MSDNHIAVTVTTNNDSFSNVHRNDYEQKYVFTSTEKELSVFTMAKAFLSISEMTNKKLQKLCYYAKAWYLALNDENIVFEQFEAWVHGAVQPELYRYYKSYGFDNIPKISNTLGIQEEYLSFAKEVYDSYGHLSGDQLEKLNHQELPWINARKGCEPWENSSNIILENDMKIFFREMIENGKDSESAT